MEINYDHIYYFLAVTVAFQSIFFSIFLLTFKSHKNTGNYFLAAYLFFTAINYFFLAFHEFMAQFSSTEITLLCLNAYGPLLYFYLTRQLKLRSVLINSQRFLWIHFTPALYTLTWAIFIKSYIDNVHSPLTNWIHIPTYIFLTVYLAICNYHLYKKTDNILSVQSTLMIWLRFLYGSSLVITASFACIILFIESYSMTTYFIMMLIVTSGKLFFVSGLLFLALRYPDLIIKRNYLKDRIAEDQNGKYAYSNLDKSEAQQILNKLKNEVEANKTHTIPGISLEGLSARLDEEPKHVSQSINQLIGKNFKEYINQMRVIEAGKMFSSPEYSGMRINEIMYDVGFRSKSSFNSNFKKYMGHTPKEYRKRCLPDKLRSNNQVDNLQK